LPFWLIWRIWKSRNDLVFNKKAIAVADVINQAIMDTKEWLDVKHKNDDNVKGGQTKSSRTDKWQKPGAEWVKCNYDVSNHAGRQDSGLRWIIRNSQGTCLDCGCGKFQGRQTIKEAECTALIWAIQCAWDLGYRRVEFEGDNITVNRLIRNKETNPRLRYYLEFIQQWSKAFTTVKFTFRHREQNVCVDVLAKKAVANHINHTLYHFCPRFLMSFVNKDAEHVN